MEWYFVLKYLILKYKWRIAYQWLLKMEYNLRKIFNHRDHCIVIRAANTLCTKFSVISCVFKIQFWNMQVLRSEHIQVNPCHFPRCLLNKKAAPVMKIINGIFGLILKFRSQLILHAWQADPDRPGNIIHPAFQNMRSTYDNFNEYARFLFKGNDTCLLLKMEENGPCKNLRPLHFNNSLHFKSCYKWRFKFSI